MMQKVITLVLTITALTMGQQSWATVTGSGTENDPFIVDNWADLKAKMEAGGYIRLNDNVTDPDKTSTSYLVVPAGVSVILDLNGHKIDRDMSRSQQGGYVILLNGQSNNHASLIIRDSQGDGKITGGYDGTEGGGSAAGGINVQYGDLTLEGGSICGNKCTFGGGGGVRVAGGTFTMTGGSIIGNVVNTLRNGSANAGGAIYGYMGDIYLRGGSITDNIAYGSNYACGGIAHDYANSAAQLHLSGTFALSDNSKISYNTSDQDWTTFAASDYLHGNRELIILDGPISPTAPIAIDLYSGYNTRLTTNWSTHMGTANPSGCFTLVANSESSGKLIGLVSNELHIDIPEVLFWGADANHDGSSAENAYIITTPEGLDYLATYVNGGNSTENKFFKLGNDITYTHKAANEEGAATENNYTAIGGDYNFHGTFDGDGNTISGIRIYQPDADYQGLFGNSYGTIQNVIVSDAVITGKKYVGGIAGYNFGKIQDCFVIGTNVSGTQAGAIIGSSSPISSLQQNYYHGCNVNGKTVNVGSGANSGDLDNGRAEAVYAITPASGMSVSGATVTYNNVPYFAKNAQVTLSYSGEITQGYNAIRYDVTSASGSTDLSGYYLVDGYTFLMPPVDLLASVNENDLVLFLFDIDYNKPDGKKNADYIAIGGSRNKVFLQGRTLFKDGYWNTLCLPFSLDAAALTASPLAGATLMELDLADDGTYTHATGLDGSTLYLNFKNATSITAGKPYIIKWGTPDSHPNSNLENPVFTGVTINSSASTEVSFKGGTFTGTYTYIRFADEDKSILYLGYDVIERCSALFYPKTNASIGACCAYFLLDSPVAVKAFNLNFGEDNTATGVGGMENVKRRMEHEGASWYDLSGRKIQTPSLSPSLSPSLGEGRGGPDRGGLPRGIYIHNGKKIAIK